MRGTSDQQIESLVALTPERAARGPPGRHGGRAPSTGRCGSKLIGVSRAPPLVLGICGLPLGDHFLIDRCRQEFRRLPVGDAGRGQSLARLSCRCPARGRAELRPRHRRREGPVLVATVMAARIPPVAAARLPGRAPSVLPWSTLAFARGRSCELSLEAGAVLRGLLLDDAGLDGFPVVVVVVIILQPVGALLLDDDDDALLLGDRLDGRRPPPRLQLHPTRPAVALAIVPERRPRERLVAERATVGHDLARVHDQRDARQADVEPTETPAATREELAKKLKEDV